MKRILLVCVVLVSMASFQATAEELMPKQAAAEEFKPKRNEISIYGSADSSTQSNSVNSSTTSSTTTYIAGNYGRYFTPKLVGNVGVFLMQSGSGTTETTLSNIGIGLKYYIVNTRVVSPFIMGDIGTSRMSSGSFQASGYMAAFAGGAAFWLTEATALNLDLKLKLDLLSASGVTLYNEHLILEVGLTTKF